MFFLCNVTVNNNTYNNVPPIIGYNGYNLWITSRLHKEKGYGDEGLWTGGGYEGTHFWIDPKRDFVGLTWPNK